MNDQDPLHSTMDNDFVTVLNDKIIQLAEELEDISTLVANRGHAQCSCARLPEYGFSSCYCGDPVAEA